MQATEQLKEEHEGIRLMLKILEGVSSRLEAGQEINPADLEQMLELIQVFADKCHHGKEEDLLFVAMEKAGVPRKGGPISVMLMEHDTGRGYVRSLRDAIARYKAGDKSAAPAIAENARKYAALLDQHIDKENNILYMIADMHLSQAKQDELLRDFDKLENERIGPGKHEEFHRLLDRLKGEYAA